LFESSLAWSPPEKKNEWSSIGFSKKNQISEFLAFLFSSNGFGIISRGFLLVFDLDDAPVTKTIFIATTLSTVAFGFGGYSLNLGLAYWVRI
jgi:hypothetical protein